MLLGPRAWRLSRALRLLSLRITASPALPTAVSSSCPRSFVSFSAKVCLLLPRCLPRPTRPSSYEMKLRDFQLRILTFVQLMSWAQAGDSLPHLPPPTHPRGGRWGSPFLFFLFCTMMGVELNIFTFSLSF